MPQGVSMHPQPLQIVFAGGGTAGHLFPGLAVAEQLVALLPHGVRPAFASAGKAFERRTVAACGFEPVDCPCRPLPRSASAAVGFLVANLRGYWQAKAFLRRRNAALVVGLGGYASVPFARAAMALGLPLVLLEQNAMPGRATRWLAPHARLVCAAFDEVRRHLRAAGPLRVTGNPLRSGFCRPVQAARSTRSGGVSGKRLLLVLGGSGGAETLNQFVPRSLYKLRDKLDGWQVIHQSGHRDFEAVGTLYRRLGVPAVVTPFLANLATLMIQADLAVSRAGGTVLAELAACGVPAVLVPYSRSADDHQRANAEVFARAGAACIVDERDPAVRLDDTLARHLAPLLHDQQQRRQMAHAMHRRARPDAAWQVATMIAGLLPAALLRPAAA
jgi:UDP-N-acetylglucosamine--N-acetylmuramyl-(pentapeptide) pyrophosphoryl-undecaprenol N-acetylglucosamine transferase